MSEAKLLVDSHTRSWIKAVSWRILGTLTTVGVTFSVTNSLVMATSVGVIEFIAKTFLFYLHERLWIKINSWI
ncbi:hypothetical protein AYO45_01135 [Gammaproteobacteria bacterium SCGC AG-212-F23]|nr:hypothetical protein AYO45_01135 [Gammaproteobacteria bacterium SCGC AG-212-F23]